MFAGNQWSAPVLSLAYGFKAVNGTFLVLGYFHDFYFYFLKDTAWTSPKTLCIDYQQLFSMVASASRTNNSSLLLTTVTIYMAWSKISFNLFVA